MFSFSGEMLTGAFSPDGQILAIGSRNSLVKLWTGAELMTNAEIEVVDHPREAGIYITDCEGYLTPVEGLTSFLTITVDDDDTSWGEVKTLYR